MRKFRQFLIISILAIVAAAAADSAWAEVNTYDLVLTEVSATAPLTLSYNGTVGSSAFMVMNTMPDRWTITVNSSLLSFSAINFFWQEPEDPLLSANQVFHSAEVNLNQILVFSDIAPTGATFANNTAAPIFVGFENSQNPGNIRLTFNDLAATSETTTGVPDTGSTLGLLTLSSIALFGLNRFRSLRLA